MSRKPVKSLGELKYMRTLSRRTNLAGTEGGGEPPQHGRRLAARTLAQQAGRCACCEDAPPSIPLGAFLLAATELPQVALARLEQRGDVHLALGRRRHRRPRDQLSARGVRLTDTLRDPPMFTSADPGTPQTLRIVTRKEMWQKKPKSRALAALADHESILEQARQAWPHAAEVLGAAACLAQQRNRGALVCACLL